MKYKFSCVLDYNPLMAAQCYIWVISLLNQKVNPKDIYIHSIGKLPDHFEEFLESKNVNLIFKDSFDDRNRYCNKLVQLETFESMEDFDYVFLMDCDTAIVSLEGLQLQEEVYAKIVDFPNPPYEILETIFNEANLVIEEYPSSFPLNNQSKTDWNNCNGGVYIFSQDFLNIFSSPWKKYAIWCMDNKKLFTEKYSKHADQVGFALAMTSLNKNVTHLDIEWNYPTHVASNSVDTTPKVLHHHDALNEHLMLKPTKHENVNKQIKRINDILGTSLEEGLNNTLFKKMRYSLFPSMENDVIHQRDIKSTDLNIAFIQVNRPDLLQYVVDTSRHHLGFYTSHYPRVFEYTWILNELENTKRGSILDIGAGVCPLPICLNEMGYKVTTVDSHSTVRKKEDKNNWNEWGFLDYSIIDKKIESYNVKFEEFKNRNKYDYIYSVSVIEHIPKQASLKLLKKAARILKVGGMLLFTIDLIPNTENLWNLSENKEVESVDEHGTVSSFKKELTTIGFEINEEFIQKDIKDSRTDVYYIKASLKQENLVTRLTSIFK